MSDKVVPIVRQSGSNCPSKANFVGQFWTLFSKNTGWSQFSGKVVVILRMAKSRRVMWTTKQISVVIVFPLVLNIFWNVSTSILMQVKEIDINTGKIKGYGICKKKVQKLIFRWSYHSDLLYILKNHFYLFKV